MFFHLAIKSVLNRKISVLLTVMALSVSVFVLLGVEHIRHQAKDSFANTVSGVDLIVGAKTGNLNLLLYSVFRIGNPTNNISWKSFQDIASSSKVKWAIPISLGDSHKGYRVMGTSQKYFQYFNYGNKHALEFSEGNAFDGVFDVVLGANVASKLDYSLGDEIVLAHGIASTSFSKHDEHPFTVVGILEPTGTPVDETLHVSVEGIEAIHVNWQQGVKRLGSSKALTRPQPQSLEPKSITAFMLGLNSRIATFAVQRNINNYRNEPLLAILPGVALSELWQMMGILENTLRLISMLVLLAALLGLSAMLLASIRERQREVELLRIIGATPVFLFLLVELETMLITLLSMILGSSLLFACLLMAGEQLISEFGLHISYNIFSTQSAGLLLLFMVSALLAAAIPSYSIYRNAKNTLIGA